MEWRCGPRVITLGNRMQIMGILNVTPDSFSDGGSFVDPGRAVEHALEMVEQGADIIDIGGESSRPGACAVSEAEEIQRTIPIIEGLRNQSAIPISIDTTKSRVAQLAVEAGADIINDISAFEADENMVDVAAASGAGVVLMHMKGTPAVMQDNPSYCDPLEEVNAYLQQRVQFCLENGVDRDRIVVDPGIGFGKTTAHNIHLLKNIETFHEIAPVLLGVSRKSVIGDLLNRAAPNERLAGSLAVAAWANRCKAHILRVHDVLETCDVCRVMDTLWTGD